MEIYSQRVLDRAREIANQEIWSAMHLDDFDNPWEIRMKAAHLTATWTNVYKLALRLISSDGVFIRVHNWAVDHPPPVVPDFDHIFPINEPLPDVDMPEENAQEVAPPPGFAAQWNPQEGAGWIVEPMEADVVEEDGPQDDDMGEITSESDMDEE